MQGDIISTTFLNHIPVGVILPQTLVAAPCQKAVYPWVSIVPNTVYDRGINTVPVVEASFTPVPSFVLLLRHIAEVACSRKRCGGMTYTHVIRGRLKIGLESKLTSIIRDMSGDYSQKAQKQILTIYPNHTH